MALKVLHISSSTTAGAGLCAYRIHHALLEQGVDSRILVAGTQVQEPEIAVVPWGNRHRFQVPNIPYFRRWIRKWHDRGWFLTPFEKMEQEVNRLNEQHHVVFSLPISSYDIEHHPWVAWADVIHLHWAQNFLDYESFFSSVKKPVVWTLHDENILHGGFHYARYKEEAGFDYQALEDYCMTIKRSAIRSCSNLHLVALSSMMRDKLSAQPFLQHCSLDMIHNGVDISLFLPMDRTVARERLGIPSDRILLAFCAFNIANPLKGLPDLVAAVERLNNPLVEILCIGGGEYTAPTSVKVHAMGLQSDSRQIALMFSACNIFAMPSYQEAFAQSPVEAMACGLPVVAYPCSGMSDLINRENGVVATDFTVDALADALNQALSREYDVACIRAYVNDKFTMSAIAKQYIDLYNGL